MACVCVCERTIPDCPGGGIPDGTLGRYSRTVRTPALLPQHGSMAMGFGTAWTTNTHRYTIKTGEKKTCERGNGDTTVEVFGTAGIGAGRSV